MRATTIAEVRAKADEAREQRTVHAQLCGLIYARKDAVVVAEEAMKVKDYATAIEATTLARDLDNECEDKEPG